MYIARYNTKTCLDLCLMYRCYLVESSISELRMNWVCSQAECRRPLLERYREVGGSAPPHHLSANKLWWYQLELPLKINNNELIHQKGKLSRYFYLPYLLAAQKQISYNTHVRNKYTIKLDNFSMQGLRAPGCLVPQLDDNVDWCRPTKKEVVYLDRLEPDDLCMTGLYDLKCLKANKAWWLNGLILMYQKTGVV